MSKDVIHSTEAPAAIGPYSQAIRVGNVVYLSGQIGLDPATGNMVDGVEPHALQVAALPKAARVEIEGILALSGNGGARGAASPESTCASR